MSTKIAGVDVLLKAKAEDGSLEVIGGQTSATLSRSANEIDVSDKTSDWTQTIIGMKSYTIDGEGFVALGDSGQEKLENAFDSRSPLEVEFRLGEDDNADGVTYTGQVLITSLENSFGSEDAVTFSISLKGTGALTRTVGTVTTTA
ncbi:phage tail tube protein [Halobacillus karajensis]|uniref:phage tail tube protein n=1 Tax=Halobacillus karajensis TaxID=195088 RepID=UPI00045C4749|nr:phage major tail protein, TP901-1 family [Halobacillus karajensis]CDQ21706.1 phage major tail protein, TP901-1 family [Halobacillus karajensis]